MSLFFVLMRSPNDAILKFPFNYKVTFCLYDQTPQHRHIIDSFQPDIKSNSFQRPRSEMNIGSGIPKFVPLAMIQQEGNPYVRDDTMFIKIMVNFSDMQKTLLLYALSLNPGLPMHAQQILIKQELERRTQQQSQQASALPANRLTTTIQSPIHVTQSPIHVAQSPIHETQSPSTFSSTTPSFNLTNNNGRSHNSSNSTNNESRN